MRSLKKTALVCLLVMSFCVLFSVKASASELEEKLSIVDGSALTQESFAEDTVSILTRGNHLNYGNSLVQDQGGRVLAVSGKTMCHLKCDTVVCNLYLEQLSDGNWYTYKYWKSSTTNAYSLSVTKTASVEGGHYYRTRGAHSATKNGAYESVSTTTNGIWVS